MFNNCQFSEYNMYNVPSVSFIGGSRQEYAFHFYEQNMTTPFSVLGATEILFSVVPYGYSNDVVLDIVGILIPEEPYNSIKVILESWQTQSLFGKYAYQLVIKGYQGGTYVPVQGILNISRKFENQ